MAEKPDNQDLETLKVSAEEIDPRMTSHLASVKLPFADRPETKEAEEMPEVTLPKTLKKAHEALASARTEEDPKIRAHKILKLTNHIHALSCGLPAPHFTSSNSKALNDSQTGAAEEIAMLMICRQNPIVKKFLDRDADALAKARATIETQAAEIESLKNPKK